jgi:hypothetical protein
VRKLIDWRTGRPRAICEPIIGDVRDTVLKIANTETDPLMGVGPLLPGFSWRPDDRLRTFGSIAAWLGQAR